MDDQQVEEYSKLIVNALNWKPSGGQGTRPELYWRVIMRLPYERKEVTE